MSDALLKALMGSQYSAGTDPLGIASQGIAAATPLAISPYASPGRNMGVAVGGALLGALLGGLAQNRADSRNQELFQQASTLLSTPSAERAALIQENPRLASIGTALQFDEMEKARALQQKKAEQALALQFEQDKARALLPIEMEKVQGSKMVDALMSRGEIIDDEGKRVQIFDPAADAARKAEMEARGKLKGEADALGYNPKAEEEVDKLRKEFSGLPEVKDFSRVEKAAGIINKALQDDNAVTDLELTRYSILVIEPGMAVREGEQQGVLKSQSIPEEWKGELTKVLTGKSSLRPEVREGLKRLALRAYEGHKAQYDRTLGFYQNEAKQKGLDPSRISYIGEAQPSEQVLGASLQAVDPNVPPGMKLQRNPKTGETRLVPQ